MQDIKNVLRRHSFPQGTLEYRKLDETYQNIAQRIMPNVIVEDDCESIGGERAMTYPNVSPEAKARIKSIVVREFQGIDKVSI